MSILEEIIAKIIPIIPTQNDTLSWEFCILTGSEFY